MTFRMLHQLQEFDFNVVHRAGAKHGNADGLSRMLEEGPDWMPGEKEKAFGSCPEPISLEEALQEASQHRVETVTMVSDETEDRRGVGPKEKEAAYFHCLIDRCKCVESFGEDEVDRGWVKSESEVPKQCWRPPDDQVTDEDGGGD